MKIELPGWRFKRWWYVRDYDRHGAHAWFLQREKGGCENKVPVPASKLGHSVDACT